MLAARFTPARFERVLVCVAAIVAAALLYASWRRYLPTDLQEAFGFVTGAACVWLGIKQNVWSWPVGIVNNVLYFIVFLAARLFADAGLQIAFAAIAAYGWYAWLNPGTRDEPLAVSRTPRTIAAGLAGASVLGTAALTVYLGAILDAAPFLDAVTTTLSLAAQYLMTRKYLECWWVWIAVDVISIGLYAYKQLAVTAVLSAIYLAMCVVGARSWKASLVARAARLARA